MMALKILQVQSAVISKDKEIDSGNTNSYSCNRNRVRQL